LKSGKKLWRVETGNRVLSSPVVVGGVLYVGSMDGFLYAINARNGRVLLKFKAYDAIVSSPAVSGDTVFVGNTRGRLYAIDRTAKNWPFENVITPYWKALYFYGDVSKPPPVSGYVWSIPLRGNMDSSPLVTDGRLYVGVGSRLVAIDIASRTIVWEFGTGGPINASPSVSGDTIYIGSTDGRLYALDAGTGRKRWAYAAGGRITSSVVVSGGTIYFGSYDGNLYAIH
jgi:outer membrane protein assembly factor BamB